MFSWTDIVLSGSVVSNPFPESKHLNDSELNSVKTLCNVGARLQNVFRMLFFPENAEYC